MTIQTDILDLIKKTGRASLDYLRKELPYSDSQVHNGVKCLKKAGKIVKIDDQPHPTRAGRGFTIWGIPDD